MNNRKLKAKRALITGATGYIGSNLTRHLLAEGWVVDVVVRPSSNCKLLDVVRGSITIHCHDGTSIGMASILSTTKPDVVFHLASLILAQHTTDDIEGLIKSNLLFSTQLLEAMSVNGVHNLINTGTIWQHLEGKDYSPVNLYAATKQAFEMILQYYIEARGLHVITLKLSDTYGPEDPRPKLINLLRSVAQDNHSLSMSPGYQIIDLVHINDVVSAFIEAETRFMDGDDACHEQYVVLSDDPLTVRALVGKFENVLGRKLPIDWGGRPARQREMMEPWQGTKLPNWSPSIDLTYGLSEILFFHSITPTT
jgi:nucleoside-diphosphate-sugar epimerase